MTMSAGVRWKEDYIDLHSDVALAGGEEMVGGVPPLVDGHRRQFRQCRPPWDWACAMGFDCSDSRGGALRLAGVSRTDGHMRSTGDRGACAQQEILRRFVPHPFEVALLNPICCVASPFRQNNV